RDADPSGGDSGPDPFRRRRAPSPTSSVCSSGSSLSALSSSTVTDVVATLRRAPMSDAQGLRIGRWATIGWGLAFIAPATIFRSDEGSIVVLALDVAGITYGGLLGAFLFGIVNKRARAADANIAFVIAVAVNAVCVVLGQCVVVGGGGGGAGKRQWRR